jgi:hypothetical protein
MLVLFLELLEDVCFEVTFFFFAEEVCVVEVLPPLIVFLSILLPIPNVLAEPLVDM